MNELSQHLSKGRLRAAAALTVVALIAVGIWLWTSDSDDAQSSQDPPFVKVTPDTVAPGESIGLGVVNPSSEPVAYEPGGKFEKLSGSDWVPSRELTEAGQAFRLVILEAPAGESRGSAYAAGAVDRIKIPEATVAGEYRILKPRASSTGAEVGAEIVGTFTVTANSG